MIVIEPLRGRFVAGAACSGCCAGVGRCWLAIVLVALVQSAWVQSAAAADLENGRFTLSGFGTLGADYQNTPGMEFRRTLDTPRGARAGEIDFSTDSRLGLQLAVPLVSGLDVSIQGLTKLSAHDDWRPVLNRAFIRYTPDESLILRIGRIGLGAFQLADAPDVGYSYLPIRPPPEVYGILFSDDVDGADFSVTRDMAGGVIRARVVGGRIVADISLPDGSVASVDLNRVGGVRLEYGYRDWQIHTGAIWLHTDKPDTIPTLLLDGLRNTGVPQAVELADFLTRRGGTTRLLQFGLTYDSGTLLAQLMGMRENSDQPGGPKNNSAFVLLGRRYRQLTQYLQFAMASTFADVHPTGLPDTPPFAPLNAAANAVQTAAQYNQRTLSIGARYDIGQHLDLKAQIDHSWISPPAVDIDRHVPPRQQVQMTIVGLALDFVF